MIISQIAIAAVLLVAVIALVVAAVSRHKKSSTAQLNLIGSIASVATTLEPEGAVLVGGELWRARVPPGERVVRGSTVRVIGATDHLLDVEQIVPTSR